MDYYNVKTSRHNGNLYKYLGTYQTGFYWTNGVASAVPFSAKIYLNKKWSGTEFEEREQPKSRTANFKMAITEVHYTCSYGYLQDSFANVVYANPKQKFGNYQSMDYSVAGAAQTPTNLTVANLMHLSGYIMGSYHKNAYINKLSQAVIIDPAQDYISFSNKMFDGGSGTVMFAFYVRYEQLQEFTESELQILREIR
ncbi:hypothetical protein [Candidatus Lokiarchaeum ossiferum]|uniref:hypothetical protein n=1 Tax=Candidatus Lokiarchaeum ossiferum TaxID=2951803 RepID=UPI00352D103B